MNEPEQNKIQVTSPVMIRQEDICPKACCEQKKCIITNNFQLESEFIVSESPDAAIRSDSQIKLNEMLHLRVRFKSQSLRRRRRILTQQH